MRSVQRVLPVVGLAVACTLLSFAAHSKSYRIETKLPDIVKTAPLLFYLAKGDADACGKGCSEWVAIEGTFGQGAADRFRKFVKGLGERKPPVIFNSPGGDVDNALAIGRVLRARGLTASVGVTVPEACAADQGDACRAAKLSGQPLRARLIELAGQCNSACTWALLGAAVRKVPPWGLLGVHSSRQAITVTVRAGDAVPNERIRAYARERFRAYAQTARVSGDSRVRNYMVEMGIAPELLTLANTIPHEKVQYLTRDEIVRFGIDTRRSVESLWSFVDTPTRRPFLIKSIAESRAVGSNGFQSSILVLACAGTGLALMFGEQSDGGYQPMPISFAAGARRFSLPNNSNVAKFGPPGHEFTYSMRATSVPQGFFDVASQTGGFSLVADVAPPTRNEHTFPADELAEPLRNLQQKCAGKTPEPIQFLDPSMTRG